MSCYLFSRSLSTEVCAGVLSSGVVSGGLSASTSAPIGSAQEGVLKVSDIGPEGVGCLWACRPGAAPGDPFVMEALAVVFVCGTDKRVWEFAAGRTWEEQHRTS